MKTLSEYLSNYPKQHKISTVLYFGVLSLLLVSFWFWKDLDKYLVEKAPEKLPGLIVIISIAIIVALYSYIRYVHEELMINEQSELTQNFQYSYQGQSEAAATTSNSLGELFSDIKDTQLSLMNVLLTVNGIVASVFLALIITQLRNKVLAVIAFGLFSGSTFTIILNIYVSLRVFSAILFAINLSEKQRQQDKFQERVTRLGIRHRQNIHLAMFLTGFQFLFILYLLMFEFSFGVMK